MGAQLDDKDFKLEHRVYGREEDASFQVIVLGANGGPREDTATGLLVRAPQSGWRKGSVIAVDAGAHLASIIGILQHYMPHRSLEFAEPGSYKILKTGPFAGVHFPYISAKANALYVFRDLLHSFLITHPHLDHLSAMAINTPALEYGREAKAVVALPSVIDAIKAHIFNDSIWPNLSDEGHGAGFITYRRLTEGGNQRLGTGEARGYVSVCDGLTTKCLAVTHGKCQRRSHSVSHQRGESSGWIPGEYTFPSRRMSRMSDDHGYFAAMAQQHTYGTTSSHAQGQLPSGPGTPGLGTGTGVALEKDFLHEPVTSSAFFIRNDVTGKEILIFGDIEPDSVSMAPRNHLVWDEAAPKIVNGTLKAIFIECSFDDDVRDADLFGHLCPRHLVAELETLAKRVVSNRVRKADSDRRRSLDVHSIAQHDLSYSPAHPDTLRKRKRELNEETSGGTETDSFSRPFLAEPTSILNAQYVGARRSSQVGVRSLHDSLAADNESPTQRPLTPSKVPRHVQFSAAPHGQKSPLAHGPSNLVSGAIEPLPDMVPPPAIAHASAVHEQPLGMGFSMAKLSSLPLEGLTIHIIHVKDTLVDGRAPEELILEQLESQAADLNLGCMFDVTACGESVWI